MKDKYVGTDVQSVIMGIRQEIAASGKKLRAVYWVACGGSEAALNAGRYYLQSNSRTLATGRFNSNLFVHAAPALLDDTCIVVCCTLKGTAETIEAMRTAEKAGAHTIALTGKEDTDMAKAAPTVILYNGGGIASNSTSTAVKIAAEILHQFEQDEHYERMMAVFPKINDIVAEDRAHWNAAAEAFGRAYKDDEIFYVLGCGPLEGTAYSMAYCHFNEMQTRHAVFLPSGDYFHGPFETTTKELAMVLLKSNGRTRPLDQRVEDFLKRFAGHYVIIDAAESQLYQETDPDIAEFFEPVVIWPIERLFVEKLAAVRNHPMTDRNYMWKYKY